MPQDQEKNDFNLDKILLPKKEERTPASAERVNAGVLLEGEQAAELPKQEAAPIVPQQKREGPINEAPIAPLQTYEGDVESVISQKNISAVDIVTAESTRAGKGQNLFSITKKKFDLGKIKRLSMFAGGAMLVFVAASLLYYVLQPAPSVPGYVLANTPFISVDDTQALVLTPDQFKRSVLMANLESIKEKTSVSLGLISRDYVIISTSTVKNELPPAITSQKLLSILAPNISDDLLRTIDPNYYMFGVHVYDGNQPFLMLKVDSYEQAFSGMLAWERTMQAELSPLFTRTPRPKINGEDIASSTTPVQITPTQFQDKIVENHDARAIVNDTGDILLLWAFLDRDTLVITTNDATLRELISRRSSFVPAQ